MSRITRLGEANRQKQGNDATAAIPPSQFQKSPAEAYSPGEGLPKQKEVEWTMGRDLRAQVDRERRQLLMRRNFISHFHSSEIRPDDFEINRTTFCAVIPSPP